MSERLYCMKCHEVTASDYRRVDPGYGVWECEICGSVVDEEFIDDDDTIWDAGWD